MIVDVHNHYVSPRVLAAVQREGARYGARVVETRNGEPLLQVGSQRAWRTLFPALQDLGQRQQALAGQGIDHAVLSTWLDLTGYSLPAEQGVAWARLLNDAMAEDLQAAPPGRFTAVATVPLQDGRAAAAELQRACGTLGYRGVVIGTNVNGRNLDARELDPFWAAAQDAGVPIIIHPAFVVETPRLANYHFLNLLGNPYDTAIAAASLVFGGVCDRFPDLKVVLVHGGGHFPYQIGRLDHGWHARAEARRFLARPPLDYLRWFYYDTLLYYPPALRYLASVAGSERLLLGSDYPFEMCPDDPQRVVREAGLAAEEQERILQTNPCAVFRLP
ncbi:MAG TPA: amidohydrolase family protein [Chloroflexota bacterium]|nr:amidohydrolase family protein [Chloroflexota bacterium]